MGQTLSIPDVEALPGETVSYSLNINVGEGAYTGYQYQMHFPATGFALTGITTTNASWIGGSLSVGDLVAGAATASALSLSNKTIPTGDIEIGTVEFTVDTDVEPGDYDVTISGFNFLDGSNYTPVPNVTFTVKVVDKTTYRFTLDENSTTVPIAREGVNVLVKRTIKANSWSTIVLPITLTKAKAEAAFGADVELREFTGFEVDYGDDDENVVPLGITLKFSPYTMTGKKSMKGGKPFLIKTSKDITSFEADNVTVVGSVTDDVKSDEYLTSGKFTGTLAKSVIPEDGLFISDNKFYYSAGVTKVKAFRCWLELGAVLDKDTDFGARISLSFDGETTDINTVHGLGIKANGTYDLQGRKVENPKKGLYINNGKKVVVK